MGFEICSLSLGRCLERVPESPLVSPWLRRPGPSADLRNVNPPAHFPPRYLPISPSTMALEKSLRTGCTTAYSRGASSRCVRYHRSTLLVPTRLLRLQSAVRGEFIVQFNLFIPANASSTQRIPVLIHLYGLTCDEDIGCAAVRIQPPTRPATDLLDHQCSKGRASSVRPPKRASPSFPAHLTPWCGYRG